MKKQLYLLLVGIAISLTAYSQTTTGKPTDNNQAVSPSSVPDDAPRADVISFNSEQAKAHRIATIERRIKEIEAKMK